MTQGEAATFILSGGTPKSWIISKWLLQLLASTSPENAPSALLGCQPLKEGLILNSSSVIRGLSPECPEEENRGHTLLTDALSSPFSL